MSEFVAALLGTLGGAALAIAALRMLSEKFLEIQVGKALATYQHGLNESITRLQTELGRVSDVLSRRNEREFAVVEVAWERMIRAVAAVENRLTTWRIGLPRFKGMAPEAASRAITNLPFADEERTMILSAHEDDRDELCAVYESQLAVRECGREWGELKNWLSTREIFMSSGIYDAFQSLANHVGHALAIATTYVTNKEALPSQQRIEIAQLCRREITPEIKQLGAAIRKRFGFDDE